MVHHTVPVRLSIAISIGSRIATCVYAGLFAFNVWAKLSKAGVIMFMLVRALVCIVPKFFVISGIAFFTIKFSSSH